MERSIGERHKTFYGTWHILRSVTNVWKHSKCKEFRVKTFFTVTTTFSFLSLLSQSEFFISCNVAQGRFIIFTSLGMGLCKRGGLLQVCINEALACFVLSTAASICDVTKREIIVIYSARRILAYRLLKVTNTIAIWKNNKHEHARGGWELWRASHRHTFQERHDVNLQKGSLEHPE